MFLRNCFADDLTTTGMSDSEAIFIREQYSRYQDIVDSYVMVDSVCEVNISDSCRSTTLALLQPTAFCGASALERMEIFDRAVQEVEAVIKSNLFPDMLMYVED
jgi:hypothetical protein